MKALSLGLVKGCIDEVEHRVHMTWVQPRVLDLDQVCDTQWDKSFSVDFRCLSSTTVTYDYNFVLLFVC